MYIIGYRLLTIPGSSDIVNISDVACVETGGTDEKDAEGLVACLRGLGLLA